MSGSLVLVAASGLAREVAEAVHAAGAGRVGALLDDDPGLWGTTLSGVRVSGPIGAQALAGGRPVLCAGKGRVRAALATRVETGALARPAYATVVHPHASLGGSTRLGVGCVLLAGVTATADVWLGDHVVVMPGAVLTHDDRVEDYATLCAGVLLAGGVRVGPRAYLGAGSMIREGCRIGADAVIGMGAVVLDDVPDGQVWVGNPARPLRTAVAS